MKADQLQTRIHSIYSVHSLVDSMVHPMDLVLDSIDSMLDSIHLVVVDPEK